jgi:hypothetical protein
VQNTAQIQFFSENIMSNKILAVRSIDLFLAATNVTTKNFKYAVKNKAELVKAFEDIYEIIMDDIDNAATRADILETTNGSWRHAVFPVELMLLTKEYARVALGGICYGGFVLDITAQDWKHLVMRNTALQKAA